MAPQTLNYGNSYTLTATNALGESRAVTLNFTTDGLASSLVSGIQMPEISTLVNDGGAVNNNLVVGGVFSGRTADVASGTRVVVTRFTFATAIRDFSVQINDVDYTADQYRDWLQVSGTEGASSYGPSLTTPHGNNNTVPGPHSAVGSSALIGATTSPFTLSTLQAGGTAASNNNSTTGTVNATFAQPITQALVRYGNYPLTGSESLTGQQGIGIQEISFCPMPEVAVAKSSAPLSTAPTDPNRFNIPDADIVYTLTVTNSDTSPVDIDTLLLTDILPAQITFRNADFDDGGPITTSFQFNPGSTGLSLSAGDIAYSDNGGATYSYSPGAGYDGAIKAVRFNPKGAMAANSSFTLKFRARIN